MGEWRFGWKESEDTIKTFSLAYADAPGNADHRRSTPLFTDESGINYAMWNRQLLERIASSDFDERKRTWHSLPAIRNDQSFVNEAQFSVLDLSLFGYIFNDIAIIGNILFVTVALAFLRFLMKKLLRWFIIVPLILKLAILIFLAKLTEYLLSFLLII